MTMMMTKIKSFLCFPRIRSFFDGCFIFQKANRTHPSDGKLSWPRVTRSSLLLDTNWSTITETLIDKRSSFEELSRNFCCTSPDCKFRSTTRRRGRFQPYQRSQGTRDGVRGGGWGQGQCTGRAGPRLSYRASTTQHQPFAQQVVEKGQASVGHFTYLIDLGWRGWQKLLCSGSRQRGRAQQPDPTKTE